MAVDVEYDNHAYINPYIFSLFSYFYFILYLKKNGIVKATTHYFSLDSLSGLE